MLKLSFACILATIVLGIALAGVPLKESVGAPLGAQGVVEDAERGGGSNDSAPSKRYASVTDSFLQSFGAILVSEIGDKTFFIAALLAMKSSPHIVFAGAIGALAFMTILSVVLGYAAPLLLPREITHYAAVALFFFFGYKLFVEAREAEEGEIQQEMNEVEEQISNTKKDGEDPTQSSAFTLFRFTFIATFLAEWGDRSQIATIALAAKNEPFGTTIGGIIGHAMCTGAAVLGGKVLSEKISKKAVLFIGAGAFIFFGVLGLWFGPDS